MSKAEIARLGKLLEFQKRRADEANAEVRRLQAAMDAERKRTPTVQVWQDPRVPPGTGAMLSGDQVVHLHNLHSEDMQEARRAERARCARELQALQDRVADVRRRRFGEEGLDAAGLAIFRATAEGRQTGIGEARLLVEHLKDEG